VGILLNHPVIRVGLGQERYKMTFDFRAMQSSLTSETKDMAPTVGISIALYRLKELMEGYDYALSKGYEAPIQEESEV
jgi:hypothetical protein